MQLSAAFLENILDIAGVHRLRLERSSRGGQPAQRICPFPQEQLAERGSLRQGQPHALSHRVYRRIGPLIAAFNSWFDVSLASSRAVLALDTSPPTSWVTVKTAGGIRSIQSSEGSQTVTFRLMEFSR